MIHDHADGERIFRPDQRFYAIFVGGQHPEFLEFRQVFGNGVVQGDFAFFDQHGDRDAAEPFCLRALHKNIIHRNRTLGRNIGIADAGGLLNAVFIKNVDCSRQLSALDKRSQCIFRKSRT